MKTTELTVPDMSCAHCKATIEESLDRLPGIESATADPETKQVAVSFDESRVNEDQLKLAVENAGYTVAK
jgi:copper chaperone